MIDKETKRMRKYVEKHALPSRFLLITFFLNMKKVPSQITILMKPFSQESWRLRLPW